MINSTLIAAYAVAESSPTAALTIAPACSTFRCHNDPRLGFMMFTCAIAVQMHLSDRETVGILRTAALYLIVETEMRRPLLANMLLLPTALLPSLPYRHGARSGGESAPDLVLELHGRRAPGGQECR